MSEAEQPIQVERTTLGGALRNGPLSIPNHQREYSWKGERVRKLFDDFNNAMVKQQASYFLGTFVMTPGRPPKVIDGQQRLATTMVFLAAIRDAFLRLQKIEEAQSIEQDFLFMYDRSSKEYIPRLSMNTDDRAYMHDRVLAKQEDRSEISSRFQSHRRIDDAAKIAAHRVSVIIKTADTVSRKVDALNAWIDFIDTRAILVGLIPPNAGRAYQMFKTLNDRAQRTTQGDMIKNHLFEQADSVVDEAQSKWSTMRSTIEGVLSAKSNDPLLTYLHHVSIVFNGPVKADDIFELMEERVVGQTAALRFLEALATYAGDYAAIVTPSHGKWGTYDKRVRTCVSQIAIDLNMVFIRPLMLAIAARFEPTEAYRAFRACVSWVVRFVIAGGSRSAAVEQPLGQVAYKIGAKEITTATGLIAAFKHVVPSDVRFRAAFATKTLSNGKQARFLLRELESQARGGRPDALLQPVEDTEMLSLEHILPKNVAAQKGWSHFSADERKAYRGRLGNMILLDTKDNGAIGDKSFTEKRPMIEKSRNLILTADVLDRTKDGGEWTSELIAKRQEMLADLAVARWPIDPIASGKRGS